MVLGKRKVRREITLFKAAENLNDLFEENIQTQNACVLCLTAGTEVPGSWLNALNVQNPAHEPLIDTEKDMSMDPCHPSIRDRL